MIFFSIPVEKYKQCEMLGVVETVAGKYVCTWECDSAAGEANEMEILVETRPPKFARVQLCEI